MHSQLTPYITLICASGVLNFYLGITAFLKRHRYRKILGLFLIHTACTTIYCFSSVLGLLSTTIDQMKFWTLLQYLGIAISPPLGLLFVMSYLGIKVTKKRVSLLLIIPIITLFMVATNDYHHLHYRVFEIDPTLGMPFIYQEIGLWYAVHGVFIFSCMLMGFLLTISRWKETAKFYRLQLASLAFGQFVPMLTAFLYLLGFTPVGIDPVPMILWLSSLFYLWSIGASRLFTVMPIAKDKIFNSINDGVMVVDEKKQIIEFNQACKDMFPHLEKSLFGEDIEKVWFELTGEHFSFHFNIEEKKEVKWTNGETHNIYQVRTSSLQLSKDTSGMLIIFTDMTELKELQRKLEYQAYYDELTGIYNRRAYFEKSEAALEEAIRTGCPFTVVLMDADHFKSVNDTYGHHVGDQLLVHIVETCKERLPKDILFARYGGEEFVLTMKGYSMQGSVDLANEIRDYMEQKPLITSEGILIRVTLSIGLTTLSDKNETIYQLIQKADKALYEAKEKGRNRVQLFVEEE